MVSLLRIAVVALFWAEWMGPTRPVHHLDEPLMWALVPLWWIATTSLLLGLETRLAAFAAAATGLALWIAGVGTPLASIEAWLLISASLALGLVPAGAGLSLDAVRGREAIDHGGAVLFRLISTGFFLAAALHHLQPVWLAGTRLEQLMLARFGVLVGPPAALSLAAALVVVLEVVLAAAPWFDRTRRAGVMLGSALFGALYIVLFTGTLSGIVVVLLLGGLSLDTALPFAGSRSGTDKETSC